MCVCVCVCVCVCACKHAEMVHEQSHVHVTIGQLLQVSKSVRKHREKGSVQKTQVSALTYMYVYKVRWQATTTPECTCTCTCNVTVDQCA